MTPERKKGKCVPRTRVVEGRRQLPSHKLIGKKPYQTYKLTTLLVISRVSIKQTMASMRPEFCPSMLARGSCQEPLCEFAHGLYTCDPCSFMGETAEEYEDHVQEESHHKEMNPSKHLSCPVCKKNMTGIAPWNDHARSAAHRDSCLELGIDPKDVQPKELAEVPFHTFCFPCNIQVLDRYLVQHERSSRHTQKQQYAILKTTLEDAERDKNGITVKGDLDFGLVEVSDGPSGRPFREASILVTSPTSKIFFVDLQLTSTKGTTLRHHPFRVVPTGIRRVIRTDSPASIKVYLVQDYPGRCQDRVELIFEDALCSRTFTIARRLSAIVGSVADDKRLRPITLHTAPKATPQPETTAIKRERPSATETTPRVLLPQAQVPRTLADALSEGTVDQIITKIKSIFLPAELNSETHSRHFKYLAWIEEYQAEQDLAIFNACDVKLGKSTNYYQLEVAGIEDRPHIIVIGTRVLVRPKDHPEGHWFEGLVQYVRWREVGLVFHKTFATDWSHNKLYNVRFKPNRYAMRRQHLALDSDFAEDRILFPSANHLRLKPPVPNRLQVHNPLIGKNPAQLQAVASITEMPPGSPPFIVSGPPGTGKTLTAVEAIRQVLRRHSTSKVLACAPSNHAADALALRLRDLGNDVIFRFYSPSRNKDDVPLELRDYTYMESGSPGEALRFAVPPKARMETFRVTVTTCIASSFVSSVLPQGHFSHIFVDQAEQLSEPEVMISIRTMAISETNVILSGDPKQLGPIIRSPVARRLGLEKSYLERLMELSAYEIRSSHGISIVKLKRNYRSHNAILKLPNETFYGNELEQYADKKLTDYFLNSSFLPKKNFPMVFHSVCGKDEREASSPSFFNIDEILKVKQYIYALKSDKRLQTNDSDIGVVTPYHAQARKIRIALRGIADDVKVGSVEEYQGQERKVIIISTVRSSAQFIEYDLKHTLGFVASPRRFNVAITRAQALLIIVGDSTVLSLDPLWRSFLNYIYINGGWTGVPITWDPQAPVDPMGGYDRPTRDATQLDMNELT